MPLNRSELIDPFPLATQQLADALSCPAVSGGLQMRPKNRELPGFRLKAALTALEQGANPNAMAEPFVGWKFSALCCAYACGQIDLARALLALGADPNLGTLGAHGITPFWACSRSPDAKVEDVEFLMRRGACAVSPAHHSTQALAEREPCMPSGLVWLLFYDRAELAHLALDLTSTATVVQETRRRVQTIKESTSARFTSWDAQIFELIGSRSSFKNHPFETLARIARDLTSEPDQTFERAMAAVAAIEAVEISSQTLHPSARPPKHRL